MHPNDLADTTEGEARELVKQANEIYSRGRTAAMSWQEKAVEAAWNELAEQTNAPMPSHEALAAALRAALPLIEVTPGMQKAGVPSIGKYFFKYEQVKYCIENALFACSKEQPGTPPSGIRHHE